MKKMVLLLFLAFLLIGSVAMADSGLGVAVDEFTVWGTITNYFNTASLSSADPDLCRDWLYWKDMYVSCDKYYEGICSGDDRYYCPEGYTYILGTGEYYYYGEYAGQEKVYIYCYVNGIATMPSPIICDGSCLNGKCRDEVCNPNSEWCENNNIYKCAGDGMTYGLLEDCGGDTCAELSLTHAECKSIAYYCLPSGGLDCYIHSVKLNNCYDTLEECQNSANYWCLSMTKKECVRREGHCLDGELKGTDYHNCATMIECYADSECPSGYYCDGVSTSDTLLKGTCEKITNFDFSEVCMEGDYICFTWQWITGLFVNINLIVFIILIVLFAVSLHKMPWFVGVFAIIVAVVYYMYAMA